LCDESKREHLFERSSSCWLIAWIFLPISYATTGLRKQKNGLGISQHHLGADIGVEGPPPPSMSRQRSRTSSVPYMASLSSFTQPSVAELRSRMRFLSASAKMQLRSRSVVSSLVISPGTPRSISTSSFTMPARMPTSLDANSSSSAAMSRGQR